ncbi:heme peroxidase [Roseivivax halodurans JCM 10272]|uniref:Heme peroxidase n=2 Tax=Roseivivax halodurans TaxID=93683 RepID=X7EBQ6_9RHOB|nr:heme peroxidase [Roseivivax halodurans JCM 10272]
MFPDLDPLVVDDGKLLELAKAMKDSNPMGGDGDNDAIPAGFTYLGQFVDHDITLDLTPLSEQSADPLATRNFRTPALDLDNVYGMGPQLAPYQYDRDAKGKQTGKLLIGKTEVSGGPGGNIAAGDHDLPRSRFGRAIIGDERNDENLLVSQTHLAFLKFHNRIVDLLKDDHPDWGAAELYREARRIATWHYQWIVLYDFAERLTEPGLINKIRHDGRKFYRFKTTPYIPVEFGAAAYRLGHSMVREEYNHNAVFSGQPGSFGPGTLPLLFHFTGKSGAILGDRAADADPADFPNGPGVFEGLPSNWVIDWRRFYDFSTSPDEPGFSLNLSRKLDAFVVPALHTLPGENQAANEHVLPFRNLARGVRLELPSGQAVAAEMAKQVQIDQITTDELTSGPDGAALKDVGLQNHTPLWYYILKEAQVKHDGKRLGPVGTMIIAETFLGLVHGDKSSFMWQRTDWKPHLPAAKAGHFTMVDMLNFVGELDPIGEAAAAEQEPAE